MKKLLSILMTLVMLLSACAFAEAVENENAEIILGDIVVTMNETPILDLTGLDLILGVVTGETNGMQLALGAADQEVLALNVALAGEQLLLSMTGVSGVYSLDVAQAAETAGFDADAVTNLDVNQVTEAISPEDQLALMALVMEGAALVQAGTTAAGTEEIEGVTYEVTNVDITAEQIQPLLEKAVAILDNYSHLLAETGIESFSQLYETFAPALAVSGVIYDGETTGIIDFAVAGSIYGGTEEEHVGYVSLYLEGAEVGEDGASLYVELGGGVGEQNYGLAFNLDCANENDGSWLPASDAPVDLLTAIQDETQSQQLMLQAMSSGMMALSQMAAANETVAALMGSMMAG